MGKLNPLDFFVRGVETSEAKKFQEQKLALDKERQNLLKEEINLRLMKQFAPQKVDYYRDSEGVYPYVQRDGRIEVDFKNPIKTYETKKKDNLLYSKNENGMSVDYYGDSGDPNNPDDDVITNKKYHNLPKPKEKGETGDIKSQINLVKNVKSSINALRRFSNLPEEKRTPEVYSTMKLGDKQDLLAGSAGALFESAKLTSQDSDDLKTYMEAGYKRGQAIDILDAKKKRDTGKNLSKRQKEYINLYFDAKESVDYYESDILPKFKEE